MAWVDKAKLGSTMSKFEKLPNSVGNMNAGATNLHHATMAPMGNTNPVGATKGNGPGFGAPTAGGLGGKVTSAVQSPAQHAATVKAGKMSGLKRRKMF
jgi:hypothetical protein